MSAIRIAVFTVALAGFAASAAQGQTAPAFEVASVKPSPERAGSAGNLAIDTDPAMVRYSNLSLKLLISLAYQSDSRMIQGGPAWLDEQHFDLAARLPRDRSKEDVPAMLRTLLAERFKLVVHRETKERQVYFLLIGKDGPKLKEAAVSNAQTSESRQIRGDRLNVFIYRDRIVGKGMPVPQLAGALAGPAGREVVDRTELTGMFDIDLKWAAEGSDGNSPSLFTAVQEQLGLKLEAGKGPVEVLIVDRAERIPTEN